MLEKTYLLYLIISLTITILLANTLKKNGQPLLSRAFKDNQELANSINHLLVVGFYLLNIGFILINVKINTYQIISNTQVINILGDKIGFTLLFSAFFYTISIYLLNKFSRPPQAKLNNSKYKAY